MNLQNILNDIQGTDPEFFERVSPRRATINKFLRGVSMAALPVAFGGLLKKAYGKTNDAITDILNFALTLEYLESEFYVTAVANAANIGITGAALGAITTIRDHEVAHVKFLKTVLGPNAVAKPNFDFSGGMGSGNGPFKQALISNYPMFLAVAQTFEDTGVRAYKGQAQFLASENDILTAALQIHSVEARHAAHIRRMRLATGGSLVSGNIKPWITGNSSNIETGDATVNGLIQKSYNGEDQVNQGGVTITTFASPNAASEAFDEPLDMAAVLDIVKPFIAP
jgi:hypothetical protein